MRHSAQERNRKQTMREKQNRRHGLVFRIAADLTDAVLAVRPIERGPEVRVTAVG